MNVYPRINFTEVIRELDYKGQLKEGTAIVTDFDNTVVTYGDAIKSILSLKPDEVPENVLTQIHKIVKSGAKLAIATNRPDEGFTLSHAMDALMGDYPNFPQDLEKLGVEVFGGGPLFMLEKYKSTDDAHYLIKSWLVAPVEEGGAGIVDKKDATVVCIGDRPNDLRFFAKLEESLAETNPNVTFVGYKLPGFAVEDKRIETDNKLVELWLKLKKWIVSKIP